MDNTEYVLNILKTHTLLKHIFTFFWDIKMDLADGKINEKEIKDLFIERYSKQNLTGFMGKDIQNNSINWDLIFEEFKELFCPSGIELEFIRDKLLERGIDPDKINFFDWDISLKPDSEREFNY